MGFSNEMEKIENEYHSPDAKATVYLELRQGDRSSTASEILSIDLFEQMMISETSETTQKEGMDLQKNEEVGTLFSNGNMCVTHCRFWSLHQ